MRALIVSIFYQHEGSIFIALYMIFAASGGFNPATFLFFIIHFIQCVQYPVGAGVYSNGRQVGAAYDTIFIDDI